MSGIRALEAKQIGLYEGPEQRPPALPHLPADLCTAPPGASHRVQFYEDESFLARVVAGFLATGLEAGQPAVVIATEPHCRAFRQNLDAAGVNTDAAVVSGRLRFLDAYDVLAACMPDGAPDASAFRNTIGGSIDELLKGGPVGPIRTYGEMVDLLWKAGRINDAIRLEEFWNDLAADYEFSLLCAYEMQDFTSADDTAFFETICRQHTHVIPAEGYSGVSGEARLAEISRLQQREKALEAEIAHRSDLEERLRKALAAQRAVEEALRHRERELRETLFEREALLASERAAREDAERARAQADDANKTKSTFLASMSHELRTPLNAIAGYVQLVELGIHGPVTEEQRVALGRVQRSQQHLLALINDLLNFTKLEAGRVDYRLEKVSLDEAITDVSYMMEPQLAAKGISCVVHSSPAEVAIADRDKLPQVLINLLTNAVKFTPSGGRVEVSTGRLDSAPGQVFVRVADSGCGIPAEKQSSIFDPFVQVAAQLIKTQEGTGLGLAISRELARGMGGDLRVRSKEEEGSVFTVLLPAA